MTRDCHSKPSPSRTANRVFACAVAVVWACCLSVSAAGSGVPVANPGDTTAEVMAKLGKPQGTITRGRITTFYYDRGMVNFRDGRVHTAFLVTPEEAERIRQEREKSEEQARLQAEAQRQRLTFEGEEALRQVRADKAFEKRPAADRLAFWQDFAQRYPYTDISTDLAQAQAVVAANQTQQKQSDEVKAIGQRIVAIRERLAQLDADYAASLTHWKRNEITSERDKLRAEMNDALLRVIELRGQGQTKDTTEASAGQ